MTDSSERGSIFSALGAWGLRSVVRGLRASDLRKSQRRGAALGRLLWRIDPKWKRIAESQITACLPELDARRVARENYEHYGMMVAELGNLDRLAPTLGGDRMLWRFDGHHHLDGLRQGGIIVTGHIGNWEIIASGHIDRFGPASALVKPIHNPGVDRWINSQRRAMKLEPLRARDKAIKIIRYLREGGVLIVVGDQNSLHHEGVFVPFFGRLASTHYGPAMLALRAGVPLITAFGTREPDGGIRVRYEPPIEIERTGDIRKDTWQLTARFTARIEAAVRRTPEQWFWVHRRWKWQPKPDTPTWKLPPPGESVAAAPPAGYNSNNP